MSSTNRGKGREERDRYPTPGWAVDQIIERIDFSGEPTFLEPCRGLERRIYDRVPLPELLKQWCEIDEGRDYLKETCKADIIITNPPYSLAMEFLEKSLKEAPLVVYLLRLNMLGSQSRYEFWQRYPPDYLFVLSKRPSFVGDSTDSCEYGWFVWAQGERWRVRAHREINVLPPPPVGRRTT